VSRRDWTAARAVSRLLNLVVLAVSGAYLLVYLYRWEWNRAVISGVFFIAAEIALATSLLLGALRRRGGPADAGTGPLDGVGMVAAAIATANGPRATARRRFRWLASNDRLGVFVPVLLGAGVLLSALAFAVERLASAVAGPALDRHTATLVALDLPLGDPTATVPPSPARATGAARALGWLVGILATAVLAAGGIDVLADATQSRPSPDATAGGTVVTLEVEQRRLGHPPDELAEALWVACRNVAPARARLDSVRSRGDGVVDLEIEPALGELRRRRLFGCLEDATLDRVRADVTGWASR
jgi:hypothetical protein